MIDEEWYLGDDYDCEDCGGTYNRLVFHDLENGEYNLYTSIGCYGGKAYIIDEVDQLIEYISSYEYYDETMEHQVRSAIEKYKISLTKEPSIE